MTLSIVSLRASVPDKGVAISALFALSERVWASAFRCAGRFKSHPQGWTELSESGEKYGRFLIKAALTAVFTVFSFQACILNIDPGDMLEPGPYDGTDIDLFDFEDKSDQPDLPPDIPDTPDIPEVPEDTGCDIICPEDWVKACKSATSWCISPYIGRGNCCEAWDHCILIGGVPGFWPNAGPHDDRLPPDFTEHVSLPAVVISFSGYTTYPNRVSNISCFSPSLARARGANYYPDPNPDDCLLEACIPWIFQPENCGDYSELECCVYKDVGCRCEMPFWCVIYDGV